MLLEIKNLKKYFPLTGGFLLRTVGHVKAVDDVSFTIDENEVLGLVGESGCGKSTVGKSVLRLIEPTAGTVTFKQRNVLTLTTTQLKEMRRSMQIIFQDPMSSLNPRMSVGNIIEEPLIIHRHGNREQRRKKVNDLLDMVGLAANVVNRYPHEFSGGQCQRIGIARALALNPKLIIADEPVSALDVSIRAQIINLLIELKKEFGLSYLFISHDLGVVRYISNRIAVMYLGKIVESGTAEEVCDDPLHPYTKALLSAVPIPEYKRTKSRIILQGDVPSPSNPPPGCTFHTRCPVAVPDCKVIEPELLKNNAGRWVRCPYV
jgi:oligopeptide/dipeptide ABC transporter ATP-binding protein